MNLQLPLWVVLCALLCGCQTVFLAHDDDLGILPEEQELALGAKAFRQVVDSEPKSANAHWSQIVERVGQRIASASQRKDYDWEFVLLAGSARNAFCLPGGKVAVYEGILPVCENEAGLAAVMSHEVAHVIFRHGAERMSHQMSQSDGHWTLSKLLGTSETHRIDAVRSVYGVGTEYGSLLPFSRSQEFEADTIGMNLMARAGYDPQEAVRFWKRFASHSSSQSPAPELLAVHPTDEKRQSHLEGLLPRSLAVYQSAPQKYGLGEPIPAMAIASAVSAPPSAVATPPAAGVVTPPATAPAAAVAATPPAVPPAAATPAAPAAAKTPVETAGVSVTVAPVVKVDPPAASSVPASAETPQTPAPDPAAAPADPAPASPSSDVTGQGSPPAAGASPDPGTAEELKTAEVVPDSAADSDAPLFGAPAADAGLEPPDEWVPHVD